MSGALILFDIDGTLMLTGGAGSRCLRRTGRAILGETFRWCPIPAGMLDQEIYTQLAQHNGIEQPDDRHHTFRDHYLRELERELACIRDDITVLPGVHELLDALHARARRRGDVTLGLLSGNYRKAAQLKLAAAGLDWSRFPITVLAEDGGHRNDLPAAAMRQYEAWKGRPIAPQRVVVVGDTPRDIACARAHGCEVLAVATGRYSVSDLRAAGAEHVLPDLAQPDTLDRVLGCVGLAPDRRSADGPSSPTGA